MTIDEAIKDIKDNIKPVVGGKSLDMAIEALERQRWIPVTEIPPYGKDLMLKLHDRRRGCDCFYYFAMGFYDGREYHTYLFKYQDDHDLEVVGWQLCPWKGEQE